MEIRRVEQDSIKPPAANAQGASVEKDRHPGQPRQDSAEHHDPADEPAEDAAEASPREATGPACVTAYTAEGIVQHCDPPPPEGQHIDRTA